MSRDKAIKVTFSTDTRKIAGQKVIVHIARCLEDDTKITGASEAEAARYLGSHLAREHPGRPVRKV